MIRLARGLALVLAACSHAAPPPAAATPAPACAPTDDAAVTQTVVAMYAALATDDLVAFRSVVTDDFYAFERGARMDGDALPKAIADAHAKGRRFEWHVTQSHVTVDCHLATVTFVTTGALGDASAMQPVSWTESATLRFEGRWRIAFFHSTRVPPPT